MESVQKPINRGPAVLTLTSEEQDILLRALDDTRHLKGHQALFNKFQFLFVNSGDACRHSAQSPDAVGQGGTIHDCRNTSDCLCLKCFEALSSLGGNQ
jgi:hypothetical protein